MDTRITFDQLEQMKTHEIADLLTNVVRVLRRFPNVDCSQLFSDTSVPQADDLSSEMLVELATADEAMIALPQFNGTLEANEAALPITADDLTIMTVAQLKVLAKELSIPIASKIKKDELVTKILARKLRNRSEQLMMQQI